MTCDFSCAVFSSPVNPQCIISISFRPMMRNKSIFFSQNSNAALSTDFTDLISSSQYDTSKFASLFAERCPSYTLIACEMRGEMRLWVMCLKGLEEEIDEIHVSISSAYLHRSSCVLDLMLQFLSSGCGGKHRYWISLGEQGRHCCNPHLTFNSSLLLDLSS